MTKEQTKEAIKVMQAYADGEQIEIYEFSTGRWADTTKPLWNWTSNNYRIKPEPKHRPYSFEEMCEAVKKHGTLVKLKDHDNVYNIFEFNWHYVVLKHEIIYPYNELLREVVWLDDNSPCGIMEE